jgi:hypothetical protein
MAATLKSPGERELPGHGNRRVVLVQSDLTPYGFCECGCGERTSVSGSSNAYYGYVRGVPRKLVHGHVRKKPLGEVRGFATDHAWAAGVIDGEGCIHLRTTVDNRWVNGVRGTNGKPYRQSTLTLTVAQAGQEIPEMLTRLEWMFGGSISKPQTKVGRRTSRTWSVAALKAETVLTVVLPYLVGKRDQAEIALRYRTEGLGRGKAWFVDECARQLSEAKKK